MSKNSKTKKKSEKTEWMKTLEKFPEANFLQSPEYGKMNEILGEKVLVEEFEGKGRALMIVREAKRGRYLEIPCGPLIDWGDLGLVREVFAKIREVAKREKCVFVRIRPQLNASAENLKKLADLGLKKSPMHLAAEHTVMIDLSRSEDELLAAMRRQTRYEVRRAGKLGITVERGDSEELFREFHEIQLETAKRQGFVPPSLKVLLAEREAFLGRIWIYVARTGTPEERKEETSSSKVACSKAPDKRKGETNDSKTACGKTPDKKGGEAIAYGLIIHDGNEGDYYEAASTDLNRKLPGAYGLLWQVIRDLKKEGVQRFNLWGIAPAGQPGHRYAGVTTFKTGFGGEVTEFVPAHDMVISKIGYMKNLIVEKARKKWRRL